MINVTTAFILGAKVLEKHFTHNKKLRGNDHYHSMDFADLKILSNNLKKITQLYGKFTTKIAIKSELKSRKFARRSIVAAKKDLQIGSIVKEKSLYSTQTKLWNFSILMEKVVGKKN